ncbi:MAG: transglycosylase domain-containing protein [Candidatus Schekmanbacteria bacterium]|nr:transglycosylase domain-containing protein [Candidatus Schekmanbacteria bacterium]
MYTLVDSFWDVVFSMSSGAYSHVANPQEKWHHHRFLRWSVVLVLLASLAVIESHTYVLQSFVLAELVRGAEYIPRPGASSTLRPPSSGGPFDERLGYADVQAFTRSLAENGYVVRAQAQWSPQLVRLVDAGLFPPYREKYQAGLTIRDRGGKPLFQYRSPEHVFASLAEIPPVLVRTLLYIENRSLLDEDPWTQNPAVEWERFSMAMFDYLWGMVDPGHKVPGASTLATQLEKFRHSSEGRTSGARDKLRQMASAAARAYLDGRDTRAARERLVLQYINSIPLAAAPGFGEVIGIGDGLAVWYGADFTATIETLRRPQSHAAFGEAYRMTLCLFLAQRRPAYYLLQDPQALDRLADTYLGLVRAAGILTDAEANAARRARRHIRTEIRTPPEVSFIERKGANAIRARVLDLLPSKGLYDIDRLDLEVSSTIDHELDVAVADFLHRLLDPDVAAMLGLREPRLFSQGDPAGVTYSFSLYEATADENRLLVETDSLDQPFNVNEGIKFDLGSTAKLRTLVTYLEIVESLYLQWRTMSQAQLRSVIVDESDQLGKWVREFLLRTPGATLEQILDAAMERKYSANPGEPFFTGGGRHYFENFDPDDNGKVLSVREAFRQSVNLVFIRIMRDIVRFYMFRVPGATASVLKDPASEARVVKLKQFADREGKVFLAQFYRTYKGLSATQALDRLCSSRQRTPSQLVAILRSTYPDASLDDVRKMLASYLPEASIHPAAVERYFLQVDPLTMVLADRGYVARVHPLELWTVGFLRTHPQATMSDLFAASVAERQHVYGWLFKTRHKSAQDSRIRTMLELEAFLEIHRSWQRVGYPFASLTPSYATAIGSSADRPSSLAELMGIIVNGGVRKPTVRIRRYHFAKSTPYETVLDRGKFRATRLLSPEVAATVRASLLDIVDRGTARRLSKVMVRRDGALVPVGGKTGTGDHRFKRYGRHGELLDSRVVSRSAAFVFMIDDRYFGAITAFVAGPEAARYAFTSALPVTVLKLLTPILAPLYEGDSLPAAK